MPRPAFGLLACLIALTATACGSDTGAANDYVAATNRAVTSFESRFAVLQSGFTATSTPSQDIATLDRFSSSVAAIVRALKRIKPPSSVASLHARLVGAVEGYNPVIAKAKREFRTTDARKLVAARTRFSVAITQIATQITAAIEAINTKLRS
jgi:hypothetical protein